ncbi:MAG: hypothetical protein WCO35_02635 [Candidatus Nomurabacteria bacterium]
MKKATTKNVKSIIKDFGDNKEDYKDLLKKIINSTNRLGGIEKTNDLIYKKDDIIHNTILKNIDYIFNKNNLKFYILKKDIKNEINRKIEEIGMVNYYEKISDYNFEEKVYFNKDNLKDVIYAIENIDEIFTNKKRIYNPIKIKRLGRTIEENGFYGKNGLLEKITPMQYKIIILLHCNFETKLKGETIGRQLETSSKSIETRILEINKSFVKACFPKIDKKLYFLEKNLILGTNAKGYKLNEKYTMPPDK